MKLFHENNYLGIYGNLLLFVVRVNNSVAIDVLISSFFKNVHIKEAIVDIMKVLLRDLQNR